MSNPSSPHLDSESVLVEDPVKAYREWLARRRALGLRDDAGPALHEHADRLADALELLSADLTESRASLSREREKVAKAEDARDIDRAILAAAAEAIEQTGLADRLDDSDDVAASILEMGEWINKLPAHLDSTGTGETDAGNINQER